MKSSKILLTPPDKQRKRRGTVKQTRENKKKEKEDSISLEVELSVSPSYDCRRGDHPFSSFSPQV